MAPAVEATLQKGATTYKELCAACHGADGRGTPIEGTGGLMAPPLVGSNRVLGHRDYVIKTLLHGLTGPIDGRNYGVMVPMGANSDEWVATIASYIRSGFGTNDWLIAPADVARGEPHLGRTRRGPSPSSATFRGRSSPPRAGRQPRAQPRGGRRGHELFPVVSDAPQAAACGTSSSCRAVTLTALQFESRAQGGRAGGPRPPYLAPQSDVSSRTHVGRRHGQGGGSPPGIQFAPPQPIHSHPDHRRRPDAPAGRCETSGCASSANPAWPLASRSKLCELSAVAVRRGAEARPG